MVEVSELMRRWNKWCEHCDYRNSINEKVDSNVLADETDIVELLKLKDFYKFNPRCTFVVAVADDLSFYYSDINYNDKDTMEYVNYIKEGIKDGRLYEFNIPEYKNGNYDFTKPALLREFRNLIARNASRMIREKEEASSMEMTDEVIDSLAVNKEKPLSEMFNEMIFNSGNSEELVMRVNGLDPYYLELFFAYIMNSSLDAGKNGYDTNKVKHAIYILGKRVHYGPFKYLATMDYFSEEDYNEIIKVLEFVLSNEECNIEEEV